MHVRKPKTPDIAVRFDIFQLTKTGISIALHEHVRTRTRMKSQLLYLTIHKRRQMSNIIILSENND